MKLLVRKGTTSKLLQVWVPDSASTTGSGKTGIAYNAAGLTASYYREGAGGAVAITLASATLGTFTSGGWVEVDATKMPGLYQLGVPDAAIAGGAGSVAVLLKGASGMAPVVLEIQLVDFDPNSATDLGLSRLDAAISSRSTVTTAQVNAEVVDVLTVDTIPELGQAQPATTPTFREAVMLLYMALRNQLTQTASEMKIRNNAGAVICKSATSDDGTTFTRDRLAAGP
jgi:hypothetical protein